MALRVISLAASVLLTTTLFAQMSPERERARPDYRAGWQHMRVEAWSDAAQAFQRAINTDPSFEDAYYSLGRARMALKTYGEAIAAYVKCRDLYRAQLGRHFSNRQEVQRYRRDRITEIDELIRQTQQGPQTPSMQERQRQLQEHRRQLQEYLSRGDNMTIEQTVPAFVSLALGSAFFRVGQWPDAEREYKAAIAADPKTGEAYNNLAVVYLTTGRFDEAAKAVQAAEKAGYKVSPGLKDDIKMKKGA
jgi:tetratricopeptide (TPR) repeat protein